MNSVQGVPPGDQRGIPRRTLLRGKPSGGCSPSAAAASASTTGSPLRGRSARNGRYLLPAGLGHELGGCTCEDENTISYPAEFRFHLHLAFRLQDGTLMRARL